MNANFVLLITSMFLTGCNKIVDYGVEKKRIVNVDRAKLQGLYKSDVKQIFNSHPSFVIKNQDNTDFWYYVHYTGEVNILTKNSIVKDCDIIKITFNSYGKVEKIDYFDNPHTNMKKEIKIRKSMSHRIKRS